MKQQEGKNRAEYIEGFSGGCTEFGTLKEAVGYISKRFDIPSSTAERRIITKKNTDWILLDDGSVIADTYAVKAAEFLGSFPYGTYKKRKEKKLSDDELEDRINGSIIKIYETMLEYCESIRSRDYSSAVAASEALSITMFEINALL